MNKPSYLNSSFSIITITVVLGLTGLCVYTKDVITLKEIAILLLGAYGVKKGAEMKGSQNGDVTPTSVQK